MTVNIQTTSKPGKVGNIYTCAIYEYYIVNTQVD